MSTMQHLSPSVDPPQIGQTELERIVRGLNRRQRVQESDTGWVNASFAANVSNFGAGFRNVQLRKFNNGEVIVRGLATFAAIIGGGGTLITLPLGYRPFATEIFSLILTGGAVRVDINTNGIIDMPLTATSVGGYLSLSGVRFFGD